MIKSFSNKMTENIFHGIYTHGLRIKLPSNLVKDAQRKLDLLNCAESLESLRRIPSIKAETVRGAHGKYSITIYQDLRIEFGWNSGPENIEIKNW